MSNQWPTPVYQRFSYQGDEALGQFIVQIVDERIRQALRASIRNADEMRPQDDFAWAVERILISVLNRFGVPSEERVQQIVRSEIRNSRMATADVKTVPRDYTALKDGE